MNSVKTTTSKKKKRKKRTNFDVRRRFYHKGPFTDIFDLFVKPFLKRYTLTIDETEFREGIEAFFDANETTVLFCKVKERFKHPGTKWSTDRTPYNLTTGVRREYLNNDTAVTVRLNPRLELRYCEMEVSGGEFDGQTFVCTQSEWETLYKPKLEVIV